MNIKFSNSIIRLYNIYKIKNIIFKSFIKKMFIYNKKYYLTYLIKMKKCENY